jgi:o-succinylbenzoate synthase
VRAELQTLHATIDVANASQRWVTRSSLRLMLDDERGHHGVGEAAPLPGWSQESVRDARVALEAVRWPDDPPLNAAEVRELVSSIGPPSARFAAETALLSLASAIHGVPLYAMLSDREVSPVPVAWTLFGSDRGGVLRAAREAAALQVRAIKVKVGGRPLLEELELLERVRAIVGDSVELRLDANRSLPEKRLATTLESYAAFRPVFIEEPAPLEVTLSRTDLAIPIALDESIAEGGEAVLERALQAEQIGAIVLKPTLLGGLLPCLDFAQRAEAAGRDAVISHALEGVIARAAAAHLALVVGRAAPGLGDHPALEPLSRGLDTRWIDLAYIEPPAAIGLGLELAW